LGVCLGHQAIAAAFGGKIVQAKRIMHGKSDSFSPRRRIPCALYVTTRSQWTARASQRASR
jgi:anthranilate/para-aminobenzoate synthase component II